MNKGYELHGNEVAEKIFGADAHFTLLGEEVHNIHSELKINKFIFILVLILITMAVTITFILAAAIIVIRIRSLVVEIIVNNRL